MNWNQLKRAIEEEGVKGNEEVVIEVEDDTSHKTLTFHRDGGYVFIGAVK